MSDSTAEEWRPVLGYEGIYDVSSMGRVRSHARWIDNGSGKPRLQSGRVLKTTLRGGYPALGLTRDGKTWRVAVHILVLIAFIGPRPAGQYACHGNGDRTDNRVENLRWDTNSANQLDAVKHGTHSRVLRTHCPRGHAYDSENTRVYIKANGRATRRCRECKRLRNRAERKKLMNDLNTQAAA